MTTSSLIAITSIAGASRIESVAAADPVGVATSVDGPDRNDVVTITVPIDVVPGSPDIARRVKKLAKTWESQAEVGWNNAFEFLQYKCFTLRLDVDMKVRPVGFAGTDDRHLVLVGKEGGGTPGFSGTRERNPSAGSKDGTRSFDGARDGIWREDQSEAVTLHEVGHLFGLGDDYDVVVDPSTGEPVEPRQTRPKPGRGGTLMGDGGVVDQALVDRIGKQIEKLLDGLPGCETWKGTFSGTEGEPRPECVGQVEGSLTLFVSDSGRVSGQGQRRETPTDPAACQHFGTFTSTVQISGRATRDAFEIFGFTAVDGGPFRIPKSGTRARRNSFVTIQGDPDVYSVELRCVSC